MLTAPNIPRNIHDVYLIIASHLFDNFLLIFNKAQLIVNHDNIDPKIELIIMIDAFDKVRSVVVLSEKVLTQQARAIGLNRDRNATCVNNLLRELCGLTFSSISFCLESSLYDIATNSIPETMSITPPYFVNKLLLKLTAPIMPRTVSDRTVLIITTIAAFVPALIVTLIKIIIIGQGMRVIVKPIIKTCSRDSYDIIFLLCTTFILFEIKPNCKFLLVFNLRSISGRNINRS